MRTYKEILLVMGISLLISCYATMLYTIWRAYHHESFAAVILFNTYGEGIPELILLTCGTVPVSYTFIFALNKIGNSSDAHERSCTACTSKRKEREENEATIRKAFDIDKA